MAGEWLKVEACTPDKPEVLALTVKMGWDDPDLTVGKLFRVWRWFDQQTIDGNARGVTCALLDRIAGVTGFAQAMSEVGWLTVSDDGLSLPGFDKHNGSTAKNRALTAKRVAEHRKKHEQEQGVSEAPPVSNGAIVTGALAREEKKRKERNTPQPPKGGALRFPDFWASWPRSDRKGGRGKCEEVWRRGGFDGIADTILAHVAVMAASEAWRKNGGEYIPAPIVYLNGRRWDGAETGSRSIFEGAR